MGAATPALSFFPVIGKALSAVEMLTGGVGLFNELSGRNARKDISYERRKAEMENQNALNQYYANEQIRAAQSAASEKERRLALRRAVARQRANFGAQGIGSAGGSSDAVLLGIFDESEDERRRREELDNLRSQADLSSVEGRRAVNLLEATRKAEEKRLEQFYI